MPLFSRITILLLTLILTFSCSKNDSSGDDDSQGGYDYQSLNGTWAGETRILQAGDCVSGDPNWNQVELLVDIDNNGNIDIMIERQFDAQDMTWHTTTGTQWMGRVETNDSIFLTKTFVIDCFGTDVQGSADYASKLIRNGSKIRINLNAQELFCPDQNCLFYRAYTLIVND